jgi:hypothetical protein
VSDSKRLRFTLGLQNLIDVAVQIPKRSFKDKTIKRNLFQLAVVDEMLGSLMIIIILLLTL